MSRMNSLFCDCHPGQESSKPWISLVEILQSSGLLLNQPKHIEWFIDLVSKLSAIQHKRHDAQVYAFLATSSELMQRLQQDLSSLDIDSNPVKCQASPLINSYLVDELGLPFYVLSEEVIQLRRVVEDLLSGEVMGETAVLLTVEAVDFEGKCEDEKGKHGNLPYHCLIDL